MFAIVQFVGENKVDYVPKEWLIGTTEVLWPSRGKVSVLRSKRQKPDYTYSRLPVRILGTARMST